VGGLLVVDLGHGLPVDRHPERAILDAEDRVARHFEIGVLALVADEEVVRIDLADVPEGGEPSKAVTGMPTGISLVVRGSSVMVGAPWVWMKSGWCG